MKHCKFNAVFRTKAVAVAEAIGLGSHVIIFDNIHNEVMSRCVIKDITEPGKIKVFGAPDIVFARNEDWEIFTQFGRAYIHPDEVSLHIIDEEHLEE